MSAFLMLAVLGSLPNQDLVLTIRMVMKASLSTKIPRFTEEIPIRIPDRNEYSDLMEKQNGIS